MSEGLLLGVDGGATKTVAVVADASGRVLGAGRSGSSDIHAASDPDIAVDRVADAARQALRAAGVEGSDLAQAAFGLCGADWPEDMELYREGLTTRLRLRRPPIVVNDAMGALRAGTPDGVGVSLVIGTGGAIGARGPDGATWVSGMRLEASGAVELGRLAYARLIRGAYGGGPTPDFQPAALQTHGVTTVEDLVRAITARGTGTGDQGIARLAPVLLEAGHAGDPVARSAIDGHAAMLAGYLREAGRRVGFRDPQDVTLVIAGGVLRHRCTDLLTGIARRAGSSRLVRPDAEPVFGVVLLAADELGARPELATLRARGPDPSLFQTL
ncbi:MAG: BadF/BadG/BcrA/BcrD ATPase family protein [Chloroflexota bacterium]